MPCYTAWYVHLTPGTPEYAKAMKSVQTKRAAITHIIDYYYAAFGLSLPDLPDEVPVDPSRQPRSAKEYRVREMICHHLACDGVHYVTLLDVASILDEANRRERAYLAVIGPCSMLMKESQGKFAVADRETEDGK